MDRHYLTKYENGSRTCVSCQIYSGGCTECNDADCEKCMPGMFNVGVEKFWEGYT